MKVEKVVKERRGKGRERGEDREERVDSTELMEERGETFISKHDNFNTHIINESM